MYSRKFLIVRFTLKAEKNNIKMLLKSHKTPVNSSTRITLVCVSFGVVELFRDVVFVVIRSGNKGS
jgi:hypothetical protein